MLRLSLRCRLRRQLRSRLRKNTYPLRDSGFKFGKNAYPLRDWQVKKHTLEGGTSRHSKYGSAPPGAR